MERKLLNGTVDVALRLLAILATCKVAMTVDRLSVYSYFALHLSDLVKVEVSVHPNIPYRYGTYINGKDIMPAVIDFLLSRRLIDSDFSTGDFRYKISKMGSALYNQIDGKYKQDLVDSIQKVNNKLEGLSDIQIEQLVSENISIWGSEFEYESVIVVR